MIVIASETELRPSALTIDLGAVAINVGRIRAMIPVTTQIMAVVKSDAYGHGMKEVAQAALKAGATSLAVATSDEALELRESEGFKKSPILAMGPLTEEELEPLIRADIAFSVGSHYLAEKAIEIGQAVGRLPRIHHQVDTGIGRDGTSFDELTVFDLYKLNGMTLEGVYTHFAVSDSLELDDVAFTKLQIERFRYVVSKAKDRGLRFTTHAANSGAILNHPEAAFDAVRPGMILYGAHPNNEDLRPVGFEPVMGLKSRIASVRQLPVGATVSYGRIYMCPSERRIAIIPVGYGDGYPRLLSNQFDVIIGGKRCPIRGRVCMDQIMVDVTEVPAAKVGDEVILVGGSSKELIRLEDMAIKAKTIPYELTCQMTARLPRVYTF